MLGGGEGESLAESGAADKRLYEGQAGVDDRNVLPVVAVVEGDDEEVS